MTRIVPSLAALLLAGCAAMPSTPMVPGEGAARLRALRSAAERDNGLAQAQLGALYLEGAPGIEPDPQRAHRWFTTAARQGCPASQLHLGLMHLSGEHVEKDLDRATYWFRRATDQGQAALHLRLLQVHAEELPLRLRVAYEWIRAPLGAAPGE